MDQCLFENEPTYPQIPFRPVDKDGLPLKTVDEVCTELNQATTIKELHDLWNGYMIPHGRKYPLIYLRFMNEQLDEKARSINELKGLCNKPYQKI